ncbi:signal transduction histidine kinase [Methylopila capsulata]|uniref:histidine kinase n=1 Tax=Methylopila capsulata TaxID=61654 RepID=A0A9W6IUU1_9HYPH|nr:ATP-binding protein [Methylopila capsulata]MBM7850229.1 signal transduction histidine kinase [Methylopila capsulata]GLK55521.1 two-component sensor histidine kinase [Methylopila capsulata]
MWRSIFRSLRVRMALLLATAVLTTAAAGLAVALTFKVADDHVEELASAQRRLELLSAISGRVGDYALVALQTTESQGQPDRLSLPRKRVQETFVRLDEELARAVARARDEQGATMVAARSRVFAQMRGRFDFLDRQALQSIRDARDGQGGNVERLRVALDSFAASFGPGLSQAIGEERATAREAEAAMAGLRSALVPGAAIAAGLAALLAFVLYRAIARPLVSRISDVAAAAGEIARGESGIRLKVRGHDELSLAMMRFNRMAAQLARRERRLIEAQARLQEIVDERTAELRGANERLTDADRARRRFFTDVSHELRTPLTVILGEADVTLRTKGGVEDLTAALTKIRGRAKGLHRRVEDLLRVARSESGQLELELEPLSVNDLITTARASLEPSARARGVALAAELPLFDLQVEADADWLRQVVEALIANALRHTAYGGTVRLIGGIDSDGAVTIAVSDDGEGIPADDLPHVFERFYRGGSEREGSGFGIGLALARWVVERHQGTITIDSRTASPGRASGTTVLIRLPALTHRLVIGARS